MRILGIVVLRQLKGLVGNCTDAERHTRTFPVQEGGEGRGILEDVVGANREVELSPLIISPVREETELEAEEDEPDVDEEFKTFAKDFEGRGREVLGLMERNEGMLMVDGGRAKEFVERWLGYEVLNLGGKDEDERVEKVHLQRLRDILGPVRRR